MSADVKHPLPATTLPKEKPRLLEPSGSAHRAKTVNVRKIIEKHIPKIEHTEVARTIDIPKLKVVEKIVEIPRIREVVKTVPVKRIVEVEHERVNHVTKMETKTIEKEVEVMGEIIEVPKPFLIENRVITPRFVDEPVATVVAQTLQPHFVESDEYVIQVRLHEYQPEVIPVDIFLPRPVDRNIVVTGDVKREHFPTMIPLAHYNSLIAALNRPTTTEDSPQPTQDQDDKNGEAEAGQLPSTEPEFWVNNMFVPNAAGSVPLLPSTVDVVVPNDEDWKEKYDFREEYILRDVSLPSSLPVETGVKRITSSKRTD